MKFKKFLANFLFFVILLVAFVLATGPSFHTSGTISEVNEDTIFNYNFSGNVSNPDNKTLVFSLKNITSSLHGIEQSISYFEWISLDADTGILTINSTTNNHTTQHNISVEVLTNSPTEAQTSVFFFNVSEVNDAPTFLNLVNQTINKSYFELILRADDEENDLPITFNVSFDSCIHDSLNPPTGPANCSLFNLTDFNNSATNISFQPTNAFKGEYIIRFNITDLNNTVEPNNATYSQVVNWTLIWNDDPYFTFVCDDVGSTEEDLETSCYINVTDPDELNNFTFSANYTWFTFNNTQTSSVILDTVSGNASALVNFTANDTAVGNWSVNISVSDTGNPSLTNSTTYYIFVDNVNDSVSFDSVDNFTAFTSNNYTAYINASDDDLYVSTGVYNESLVFTSNTSWVTISTSEVLSNGKTAAAINFDPNVGGGGNHSINLTVRDANNFSVSSWIFVIEVLSNTAPSWDVTSVVYNLTEDVEFYANLTLNVTDSEGDSLTFSYTNSSQFDSFDLNVTTGVINFTPVDIDVGEHILTINVTDGATPVLATFNFTVNNVDDTPIFITPLTGTNISIHSTTSNGTTQEDNATSISVFAQDDDLKILSGQKGFYDENLTLNVSIEGPNSNLISISKSDSFPSPSFLNRSLFTLSFTPNKSDVGEYNITLNVSDFNNISAILEFNLSIEAINHNPAVSNISNQTSSVNRTFTIDINATDIEDINESDGNMTFNLTFISDGKSDDFYFGNESVFNSSIGLLNITFNDTQVGRYHLNISVNDSENTFGYEDFWLFVYDIPSFDSPGVNFVFNLAENSSSNLTFVINDSVGDNLTYEFYLNDILRNTFNSYGNGTNTTLEFTPNFTDETHGFYQNITLTAFNPTFTDLNASMNWSVNITHLNFPVNFTTNIEAQTGVAGNNVTLNLTSYFSDHDYYDLFYNQTVNFTANSNQTTSDISINVSNWVVTFYATSATKEMFNITGMDFNTSNSQLSNATSNYFNVTFTASSSGSSSSSSGGGGGGGSGTASTTSLKINAPAPLTIVPGAAVSVPVSVSNEGTTTLTGITFTHKVFKNGVEVTDISVVNNNPSIGSLVGGGSQQITLTAVASLIEFGTYEIHLNGTASSPVAKDSDIIYINVEGIEEVLQKLEFVNGVLDENEECIEMQEVLEEIEADISAGILTDVEDRLDQVLLACQQLISEEAQVQFAPPQPGFFAQASPVITVPLLISGILFLLFIAYDLYVRVKFRKSLVKEADIESSGDTLLEEYGA